MTDETALLSSNERSIPCPYCNTDWDAINARTAAMADEIERLRARIAELEETTHPIEVSRSKNAQIVKLRELLDIAVVAIRTKFNPPQGWLREAEIAVGQRPADETSG